MQLFTKGGAVTATVAATIDTFGLSILNTQAGASVTLTNDGTISLNAVPTTGGTAALNITTNGGNITYTGKGSVSSSGVKVDAVEMNANGGTIIMTTDAGGTITGGLSGINLKTNGAGAVTIDTSKGGLPRANFLTASRWVLSTARSR